MKKHFKKYYAATPVFWRKVGDSILLLGTLMTGFQIMEGNKSWAIACLLLTWLGKTVTNLASK